MRAIFLSTTLALAAVTFIACDDRTADENTATLEEECSGTDSQGRQLFPDHESGRCGYIDDGTHAGSRPDAGPDQQPDNGACEQGPCASGFCFDGASSCTPLCSAGECHVDGLCYPEGYAECGGEEAPGEPVCPSADDVTSSVAIDDPETCEEVLTCQSGTVSFTAVGYDASCGCGCVGSGHDWNHDAGPNGGEDAGQAQDDPPQCEDHCAEICDDAAVHLEEGCPPPDPDACECGDPIADAGFDAGPDEPADAGFSDEDAGETADAGIQEDAGIDEEDAGVQEDAGEPLSDAGTCAGVCTDVCDGDGATIPSGCFDVAFACECAEEDAGVTEEDAGTTDTSDEPACEAPFCQCLIGAVETDDGNIRVVVEGNLPAALVGAPIDGEVTHLEVGSDAFNCWSLDATCGQVAFAGNGERHTLAAVPELPFTPRARTDLDEVRYLDLSRCLAFDPDSGDTLAVVIDDDGQGTGALKAFPVRE